MYTMAQNQRRCTILQATAAANRDKKAAAAAAAAAAASVSVTGCSVVVAAEKR